MISAALIERSKLGFPDGSIMGIVIWKVPEPVPGSAHLFKYIFDNERGKGDHCHPDGMKYPYAFTSTDALLSDFRKEIVKRRQQQ